MTKIIITAEGLLTTADGHIFVVGEPRPVALHSDLFLDESHYVKERRWHVLGPDPEAEIAEEPVKQNGRSAAYLRHDPTKQRRRLRR